MSPPLPGSHLVRRHGHHVHQPAREADSVTRLCATKPRVRTSSPPTPLASELFPEPGPSLVLSWRPRLKHPQIFQGAPASGPLPGLRLLFPKCSWLPTSAPPGHVYSRSFPVHPPQHHHPHSGGACLPPGHPLWSGELVMLIPGGGGGRGKRVSRAFCGFSPPRHGEDQETVAVSPRPLLLSWILTRPGPPQ